MNFVAMTKVVALLVKERIQLHHIKFRVLLRPLEDQNKLIKGVQQLVMKSSPQYKSINCCNYKNMEC